MNRETIKGVLIACTGLPLLLVHSPWATVLLHCYLLTALLFGLLLVPEYSDLAGASFWKGMSLIGMVHCLILLGIAKLDLAWGVVFGSVVPTRMVYGILGVILVVEWRLDLYVIGRMEPRYEESERR